MKNTMKKIGKLLSLALIFLASFAGGMLLSASLFSGFFGPIEVVLGVAGILFGSYISIIVHEAGHLVFGLLSGYTFSSFRIGSLMWVKQDGKINLRRFSLAGTGGQCLMNPPEEKNGRIPVILYNLGGVIANVIFAILLLLAYFLCVGRLNLLVLGMVFLFSAIVSFILALMNGLPLDAGGIANDGMNALHLSKDPIAAYAFRNQLLANAAQTEGKRLSEMPEEWFTLPEGADMQNVHCASLAVFAVGRYLDRGDIPGAEKAISDLLNSGYNIIALHKNLLICDLIYCRLYNNPSSDISSLLTPEVEKIMQAMKTYPSIIRTQYAIALVYKRNSVEASEILASYDEHTKKFPYRQEALAERELMLRLLEKTKQGI